MDTKAMAKSKRAHSQQQNHRHSTRKPSPNQTTTKPTSNSTSSTSKTAKIQPLSAKQQTHNWDRYEEEEEEHDLGSEKQNRTRYEDVVKPKSKGADYGYLISEAKLDCFASFEDLVPDFYQGIGSILSVRGEGILSSAKDDNFIVDYKGTTSYEAPFFSLNLHTLAEKLAKVDLSKRLFIQPGLLPSEMCSEESNASKKHESDQIPNTGESKTTTTISDEVNSRLLSEKHKVAEPYSEVSTSSDIGSKKLPAFEAASSETDLDMLLDSFNETVFLNTSESKKKYDFSIPILQDSSKTSSFDDAIDDLLGETSSSYMSQLHKTSSIQNIKVDSSTSYGSGPKSKVLDDFDSWFDTI